METDKSDYCRAFLWAVGLWRCVSFVKHSTILFERNLLWQLFLTDECFHMLVNVPDFILTPTKSHLFFKKNLVRRFSYVFYPGFSRQIFKRANFSYLSLHGCPPKQISPRKTVAYHLNQVGEFLLISHQNEGAAKVFDVKTQKYNFMPQKLT